MLYAVLVAALVGLDQLVKFLVRAFIPLNFCAVAMPSAAENPWPREPAVKSMPGVLSISQWEGSIVPP